jgi:glycosyltransferase involved in cell wall biosynthesis
VRLGENGIVYPVGDVDALAHALRELLADPHHLARMGVRSREIVTAYSYDVDVHGILEALRSVVARRREQDLTRAGSVRDSRGST